MLQYVFEDLCPSNLRYYNYISGITIIYGLCIVTKNLYQCEVPTIQLNQWIKEGRIDCMTSISEENKNFILTGISPIELWINLV